MRRRDWVEYLKAREVRHPFEQNTKPSMEEDARIRNNSQKNYSKLTGLEIKKNFKSPFGD